MKKYLLYVIMIFSLMNLFAAHDFTINGETATSATIGDELVLEFSFEEVGNSANLSFSIDVPVVDIPELALPEGVLTDGDAMDDTDIDGVYSMTITASVQPPSGIPLVIKVEDGGIEAEATITFEPLDSDYSIAGNVTKPGMFGMDFPVYPAILMTLYNASIIDFENLGNLEDLSEILLFLEEHYLIMELNELTGGYQVNVPDILESVSCGIMPVSLLDFEGEHIAPEAQVVEVDGHMTGIDFHYIEPDAYINGTIINEIYTPVEFASIAVMQEESIITTQVLDETLEFSIPVMNGTYTVHALIVYEIEEYTDSQEVVVDGSDIDIEFVFPPVANNQSDVEVANNITINSYPNPFNRNVCFAIEDKNNSLESIDIYNLKGQKVRSLKVNHDSAEVIWNGANDKGNKVSNGIYLLKTNNSYKGIVGKVMLIK
jgi:hypothetical protein